MGRRKRSYDLYELMELVNKKPFIVFAIPLVLVCWSIEKWIFSLSNWVPLVVAVWATFQVILLSIASFFKYSVIIKVWTMMNVYLIFDLIVE